MAAELELKAVVSDVVAVRDSLAAHGARLVREGRMTDLRYDRDGALATAGEVLRVRTYEPRGGAPAGHLAWKGPASTDARGLRRREEHQVAFDGPSHAGQSILEALGYRVVATIDRWVEYWQLGEATARLEWYPRMDVLCEVEGSPEGIETVIGATGIARAAFRPDAIAEFVARYEAQSGPAALALTDLGGAAPTWEAR